MLMTVRPHTYGRSKTSWWGVGSVMAGIWAVSSVLVLPTIIYTQVWQEKKKTTGGVVVRSACVEHWPKEAFVSLSTFSTVLIAIEFVLPVTVMVVCHTVIACNIFNRRRRLSERGSGRDFASRQGLKHRDYKAFRLLVLIIVTFIACWSPFYGYIAYREWWAKEWWENQNRITIFYIVDSIAMSNSMFNAIFNILLNDVVRRHAVVVCARLPLCRSVCRHDHLHDKDKSPRGSPRTTPRTTPRTSVQRASDAEYCALDNVSAVPPVRRLSLA